MNRNIVKNLVKCSVALALVGFATAAAAKPMNMNATIPTYNQVDQDWYEGGNTTTESHMPKVSMETALKNAMEATDRTRQLDMPQMAEPVSATALPFQDAAGWYEGMNPATPGANRFPSEPLMESGVLPTDE